MEPNDLLARAKAVSFFFVQECFADHQDAFEHAWYALLPVFEKWLESGPRTRPFPDIESSVSNALAFADQLDCGMGLGIAVTVATALESWQSGEAVTEDGLRDLARSHARRLGAPPGFAAFVENTVPLFCSALHEAMRTYQDYCVRRAELSVAHPPGAAVPAKEFTIRTHEQPDRAMRASLAEVVAFKSTALFAGSWIKIDESECTVTVGTQLLRPGPGRRLCRVLRCLVEMQGQCVPHRTLVNLAGRLSAEYSDSDARTAERWVRALRAVGSRPLRDAIKTRPGGYAYEGPRSFTIIAVASERTAGT